MKNRNILLSALALFGASLFFASCEEQPLITQEEEAIVEKFVSKFKTPKYVFLFIGDGMASPQINLTEAALNSPDFALKSESVGLGEMNLTKFPVVGMQTTHAQDRFITGSAASATALACGNKTTIGTISMDGTHTETYKTMAEMAKEKGMKVGIVSSVSIDHATPACFYAHTSSRNNYYEIGQQLASSNFDYFAGGGVCWNKYGNAGQAKDVNVFINAAEANGFRYVDSRAEFYSLTKNSGKVIATLGKFRTSTPDGAALPYILDIDEETNVNDIITLSEFTEKGIDILDNEKGFFMMVEGGKIDWACHANDAVTTAHNMVEFDKAIGKAIAFYNAHPDETLIIVTGDHECGGLSLGFASTEYETSFDKLNHQKMSFFKYSELVAQWKKNNSMSFEQALVSVKDVFGLGDTAIGLGLSAYEINLLKDAFSRSITGTSGHLPEELAVIYGYYDPFTVTITHILNNKAGIDWTSYSHTGVPVPVFALGSGQYEFNGYYDNTDVAKRIIAVANLDKIDESNANELSVRDDSVKYTVEIVKQ